MNEFYIISCDDTEKNPINFEFHGYSTAETYKSEYKTISFLNDDALSTCGSFRKVPKKALYGITSKRNGTI